MKIVDDNYRKWRAKRNSQISMYMCKSLAGPSAIMYGQTINNPAKEKEEREREKKRNEKERKGREGRGKEGKGREGKD